MSRHRFVALLMFVSIGVWAACSDRSPTDSTPGFLVTPNLPGGSPAAVRTMGSPTTALAAIQVAHNGEFACGGGETVLLIQDVVPWAPFVPSDQDPLGAVVNELLAQDKPFCMIRSEEIETTDLSTFREILIPSDQDQIYYDNLFPGFPVGVIHKAIQNFVINGGVLSANLADKGLNFGTWEGKVFIGGVQHVTLFSPDNDIADPNHPIIVDELPCGSNGHCGPITESDLGPWGWASHGYFTNLCPATTVILINELKEPVMIEYAYGAGKVVANLNTLEAMYYGYATFASNKKLLSNEIAYQDAIACDNGGPPV